MTYQPLPAVGQKTMANSEPVVIASDQSGVRVIGGQGIGTLISTDPVILGVVNVTTGNIVAVSGDTSGNIFVRMATGLAASPVVSAVASATSTTTLVTGASTTNGVIIFNDSTAELSVLLGNGTASATNRSFILATGQVWTSPIGYTSSIQGIWAAANGFARVTLIKL